MLLAMMNKNNFHNGKALVITNVKTLCTWKMYSDMPEYELS